MELSFGKYTLKQLGLLVMTSTIMLMTNVLGYSIGVKESMQGLAVLCAIALVGLMISKLMSRVVKLPTMMYVSLTGLLLACPISPLSATVLELTNNVAFMTPATALGAFAGLSLSRDIKTFAKMGWKFVIITILVMVGTFFFSALVADLVLKVTGTAY